MNEYREWAKSRGICTNCYKEKAWNGRQMCAECLGKTQERSEATRSLSSKEQRKKYTKRKRDLCIAFGICRECLKRKSTIGLKCTECHVKEIKRRRKNRKDIPRNMRAELGLCYFCGNKVIAGKKTCPKCYEIQSLKLKLWNSKYRDNSTHIWRKIQCVEIENIKYRFKI